MNFCLSYVKMSCLLIYILLLFCISGKCFNSYSFDIKGDSLNGYYVTVFIGTPPQPINMLLDTGSSNLAVAVASQNETNSHYFLYNKSLTFYRSDIEIRLRYVEGEWSGFLGSDVFNPCVDNNCSVICNISCMTTMKGIFDDNSHFQGIMGLAYSSIANPNQSIRPYLDIFLEKKKLNNIFALFLCGPHFSSKWQNTTCGKFHVGYYSKEYIHGDIMYTPIIHEWFYEVTVIDLKVNLNSAPVTCAELNKNRSIIDSGATKLSVPETVYNWIISEIQNHVKNSYPKELWINQTTLCVQNTSFNISKFPNLIITLYYSKNGSFHLNISPELYLLSAPNVTSVCISIAIGTSNYGTVIGSTILKGFYVIFDRENRRIGFAKPTIFSDLIVQSDVSEVLTGPFDFDKCISKDILKDNGISTLYILALCFLCIIAAVLSYALTKWVYNLHMCNSDNLSDTVDLFDDDLSFIYASDYSENLLNGRLQIADTS